MVAAEHTNSLPRERSASPFWRRALGYLGGAFLGAVLLVAAWAKVIDPDSFADQIRLEGLDVLLSAKAVAFVALGLEIGLGLLLVLGVRRSWVLIPTALLVVAFLALNGRAWYLDAHGLRNEAASCGCFGNLVDRTPAEAFWQDLLLLVPPLLLAFLGRPRQDSRSTWLRAGLAARGWSPARFGRRSRATGSVRSSCPGRCAPRRRGQTGR